VFCGYGDTQNKQREINFRLEGKLSETRREVILTPQPQYIMMECGCNTAVSKLGTRCVSRAYTHFGISFATRGRGRGGNVPNEDWLKEGIVELFGNFYKEFKVLKMFYNLSGICTVLTLSYLKYEHS